MYFDSGQVNNFLSCKNCEGRLDKPRILPCGNSICSFCISSIHLKENKEFQCLVCNELHEMPKNGLPLNNLAAEILSIKSVKVSRGNAFESLQETLREIEKNKIDFKNCVNNSDDCIKEHCVELRDKVQLKTEQAICKIKDLSEKVIDEINEYEQEIIDLNKKNQDSLKFYDTIYKQLELFQLKMYDYLQLTNLNDAKLIKLNQNAIILKENVESIIKNIKNIIFSGRFLTFDANEDEIVRETLGELIMNDLNEILDNDKFDELMKLCEFPVDQIWHLIYKASKDGFEAEKFHLQCDDKPSTLVIVKSSNGNVFGGYTERSWSNTDPLSEFIDKSDPNAFIFSLINKENRPLKVNCSHNQGIRCKNTFGPIFGGKEGYSDLVVNLNKNYDNFSHFGHYYIHPDYEYKSEKAYLFLAGSHKFQVSEIEVYTTNK